MKEESEAGGLKPLVVKGTKDKGYCFAHRGSEKPYL